MIQLVRNPVEGGSVVIRITFKHDNGKFYEPIGKTVFYSLFALHDDNKTWEIVNNRNKSQLSAGSVVDIVLQGFDLALLPKCSTKRRVVVDWSYMRSGEATVGRDMIDFEVVPLPVLDPVPPEVVPPLAFPLYVREVFEGVGSKIGVLFSDIVDVSTVSDGVDAFYLGDASGTVLYGVKVTWNADNTIAWCDVDASDISVGDWSFYISGNIRSMAGSLLGASDAMNGNGFLTRTVSLSVPSKVRNEYSDGSWEIREDDKHYYWDAPTQRLWYDGPGEGLIFRKISITQSGGAHFQISVGSGIGTRDLWAWDGGSPGVGVIRHYYTKGQANDTFTADDEVTVVYG